MEVMKYEEFLEEQRRISIRRPPRHIESAIQQECVTWFRVAYPGLIILSIPNGGSRNTLEAQRLKREGALAGASDLLVIARGSVLFVEMKSKKGRQQESQKIFQQKVERLNHKYVICHSKKEFALEVEKWLKEIELKTK